jgi:hypothetical protein
LGGGLYGAGAGMVEVETGRRVEIAPEENAATVLVFVSAVCPISNNYSGRVRAMAERYAGRGVRVMLVGSNGTESEADLRDYARDVRFGVPLYRDAEGAAARRYGATVTPEAVLLDAAGTVRYRGAIDDARNTARVKREYLREALEAVLAGRRVETESVRAFGCAIKTARRG